MNTTPYYIFVTPDSPEYETALEQARDWDNLRWPPSEELRIEAEQRIAKRIDESLRQFGLVK